MFYRATLCFKSTGVWPRALLSVTSRSSTKTAKHRITKKTPYDRLEILVYGHQKSCWNSNEVTQQGTTYKCGKL